MTVSIHFEYSFDGTIRHDIAVLRSVRSIEMIGLRQYSITCFGNDPVKWSNVIGLVIDTSDTPFVVR